MAYRCLLLCGLFFFKGFCKSLFQTVAGNGMEINPGLPAATMQILIMLVLLTIMTVGGKKKA